MTITTDNAESQAKAQLENIQAMMKRMEHVQECAGNDCTLSIRDIFDGLGYIQDAENIEESREEYHNEDAARVQIQKSPLSVLVRSGWAVSVDEFQAVEYEILLCTGGPAVRIIGDLDKHGEADSAPRLEYQDWGTPWATLLDPSDTAMLIAYASTFYFDS